MDRGIYTFIIHKLTFFDMREVGLKKNIRNPFKSKLETKRGMKSRWEKWEGGKNEGPTERGRDCEKSKAKQNEVRLDCVRWMEGKLKERGEPDVTVGENIFEHGIWCGIYIGKTSSKTQTQLAPACAPWLPQDSHMIPWYPWQPVLASAPNHRYTYGARMHRNPQPYVRRARDPLHQTQ